MNLGRRNYLPLPLKRKHGIVFKEVQIETNHHLSPLLVTREYVGYDSGDSDGFGMENEYDYHFFTEKKRYLGTLCGWSRRDFQVNQDRIRQALTHG